MTEAVFFTGDRMMTPLYPGVVMLEMLRTRDQGRRIMTGTNNGGIEELVRTIGESAGVTVEVVEQTVINPEAETFGASIDWDARHKSLGEDVEVLVIHVDHLDCREARSVLATVPDERVRLLTLEDMVAS